MREKDPRPPASSSGEDSADEYVQQRSTSEKKRKRRRGTEGGDAPKRKRSTTQKKRKQTGPTQEEIENMPQRERERFQLDMMINDIVKGGKRANRPKKRKKDDVELDQYADEEVSRLRELMLAAADDDIAANREKLPATAKLRLLPQVMDVLRKNSLWQSMVDNNLMEGVRRWLEPLPDRSLPALNIQREFMEVLPTLYIDTGVLKESRLGRVVLFYTKCKRVTPDVRIVADRLVASWTRPIVKRSASYRDRAIPLAAAASETRERERLGAILARARDEPRRARPNAVAIPQRELGSYSVAPQSNAGVMKSNVSVDMDIERRKRNAERLRHLTRKMQGSQRG
ncbi:hypothetical protein K488DRAFT_43311 [Vararia minispora EC-137]|uniref:Uncharacterized protein n=1 Tax=Vararia minispora EC-137 TaxID=1314806 RepID=A0ACB8QUP5_9AGAM|nr:hypothetical protein K488DRAFT_43311 [Vararia minispora EC-137]